MSGRVPASFVRARVRRARHAAESLACALDVEGLPVPTDDCERLWDVVDVADALGHAEAERVHWLTAVVALLLWSREPTPSVDPPAPRP